MNETTARETDRIYAFCLSGLGHQNVQVDPADPSVGIFTPAVWCEDCGTDLSNDAVINLQEI
jgi:hypothetical protein